MSQQYDLRGKVKTIMDTQTFASGFSKREFVVTTEDQYPQDVKFEAVKDKIAMVDKLQEGQSVNVSFNIRGNEYQGRYYVNLQAWRIQPADDSAQESGPDSYDIPESAADDGEAEDFPF